MMKSPLLGVITPLLLLGLSGCLATMQPTAGTREGCGTAQYSADGAKNFDSISWTGTCKAGLTDGRGTMMAIRKDGGKIVYEGEMKGGRFHGQGTYQDAVKKLDGKWDDARFSEGRYYDQTGRLVRDGFWGYDPVSMWGPQVSGRIYFRDGAVVEATSYVKGSVVNYSTGQGIETGEGRDPQGKKIWYAEQKRYETFEQWLAAMDRFNKRLEADNKQAYDRLAAKKAEDDREALAMLGPLAQSLAGGEGIGATSSQNGPHVAGGDEARCVGFRHDSREKDKYALIWFNKCDYELTVAYCDMVGYPEMPTERYPGKKVEKCIPGGMSLGPKGAYARTNSNFPTFEQKRLSAGFAVFACRSPNFWPKQKGTIQKTVTEPSRFRCERVYHQQPFFKPEELVYK